MRLLILRGSLLAIPCACIVNVSTAENKPPATSPWTRVPAFPTACYASQDDFRAEVEAAKAAVAADRDLQKEINGAINEQITAMNDSDPMELARRMQEQMLADPENAMKYAQDMQTLGQQVHTDVPAANEKSLAMQQEEKALLERYQADLAKAYEPGNARWTALKKKMGIAPDSTYPGEMGVPDWAWQEWGVILREWDAADQAVCVPYFGENGRMRQLLDRYKGYLVNDQIPYHKKYQDEPQLENYRMTNIPADNYRTTAEYEAVEDYLDLAYRLFNQRRENPRCTKDPCY